MHALLWSRSYELVSRQSHANGLERPYREETFFYSRSVSVLLFLKLFFLKTGHSLCDVSLIHLHETVSKLVHTILIKVRHRFAEYSLLFYFEINKLNLIGIPVNIDLLLFGKETLSCDVNCFILLAVQRGKRRNISNNTINTIPCLKSTWKVRMLVNRHMVKSTYHTARRFTYCNKYRFRIFKSVVM
jgi:hypothetical protein